MLFDTSDFIPRAKCGNWTSLHTTLSITANLIIVLAYYIISFNLYRLYKNKSKDLPKPWMLILFIVFIFACGTTHLIDAIIFKYPIYRFLTLVAIITAIVSIFTALLLPRVIAYLIKFENTEELRNVIRKLNIEMHKRNHLQANVKEINHDLANQVNRLQLFIATQGWITRQQLDLDAMKATINNLRKQYSKEERDV